MTTPSPDAAPSGGSSTVSSVHLPALENQVKRKRRRKADEDESSAQLAEIADGFFDESGADGFFLSFGLSQDY